MSGRTGTKTANRTASTTAAGAVDQPNVAGLLTPIDDPDWERPALHAPRVPRILQVGGSISVNGEVMRIVQMRGDQMWATSPAGLAVFSIADVWELTDFEVLTPDDPRTPAGGGHPLDGIADPELAGVLPGGVQSAKAQERIRVVNLLTTGYEHGSPCSPGEKPDPELGPQNLKPVDERVVAAAARVGVKPRTVYRWMEKDRDHGETGLVDLRTFSASRVIGRCPDKVWTALNDVLDAWTSKSKVSDEQLINRAWDRATGVYGYEDWKPELRTFRRYLEVAKQGREWHLSTARRRSRAMVGNRTYRPLTATRPFEIIEIDTTRVNVRVVDMTDQQREVEAHLSYGIDVYSRSIVAWRFTAGPPTADDANLLLFSMITPKPWNPQWGTNSRWRYGMPEHLVINNATIADLDNSDIDPDNPDDIDDAGGVRIAGIPCGVPTAITVDRGSCFTAVEFIRACHQFGITVNFARPKTPTDKPHVERSFGTSEDQFVAWLDAYRGRCVADRGDDHTINTDLPWFIYELEDLFAEWVATLYQNRHHRRLIHPGNPRINMTPNEMYDHGITISGHITLPVDQQVAINLLQAKWVTVTREGFDHDYLTYNSDTLTDYRNRESPFTSAGGKWPIRVDRRDVSNIWFWAGSFKNPKLGEWIQVPCTLGYGRRPFAEMETEYVKSLSLDKRRTRSTHEHRNANRELLADYVERRDAGLPVSKQERRVNAVGRSKSDLAAADPHVNPPHPTRQTPPDADPDVRVDLGVNMTVDVTDPDGVAPFGNVVAADFRPRTPDPEWVAPQMTPEMEAQLAAELNGFILRDYTEGDLTEWIAEDQS